MKKNSKWAILTVATAFILVLGMMSSASAVSVVTINDETQEQFFIGGVTNPPNYAQKIFEHNGDEVDFLYKADAPDGADSGFPYSDNYETEFIPTNEPNDAIITWVGPNHITETPLWLVIKDGAFGTYFFNLRNLQNVVVDSGASEDIVASYSWDGKDTLHMQGFWADAQGAISNVAIMGEGGISVPEPASILFLGLGILGLGISRRFFKKN